MNDVAADGTARGLVEFLDWAAERGEMNRATAQSLRTAVMQVFQIDEGWEATDLRQLDIAAHIRRFENLRKLKFKASSLNAYTKRFRSAIETYLGYLEDPGSWKYTSRERPVAEARKKQRSSRADSEPRSVPADMMTASGRMIEYPFPLREGVIAKVVLPSDLTKHEAQRLGGFVAALAIDEQRALPAPADSVG